MVVREQPDLMLVALILSFPPPVVHIKPAMSKALRSNSFLLQLKFLTANLVHYLPLNSGCPIPLELFGELLGALPDFSEHGIMDSRFP